MKIVNKEVALTTILSNAKAESSAYPSEKIVGRGIQIKLMSLIQIKDMIWCYVNSFGIIITL